ncbi:MAG: sugar transferase [Oscillospiraceae bacterium]|nr:sugar transferase [Oscillospiraceae bacterium]
MSDGFAHLPAAMRCDGVLTYWQLLQKRRAALFFKRAFDIALSGALLVLLSPLLAGLAAAVKCGSRGPVFYRQVRVTRYMREFRIFKFRSMVAGADRIGPLVTVGDDPRVTRVGAFLRRTRLDELPQLLNVFAGDMTFVGTRPEVPKYVAAYTDEMRATLLLRAGITSPASIAYKDEARLLENAADPDRVYVEQILPAKMAYNLRYLREFCLFGDIRIMFRTVFAVAKE